MGHIARGFSMIEILVTLGLIGFALVSYHFAMNNAFLSRNARDQEIALRIASGKMAGLRALGYADLPSSGPFSDTQIGSLPSGSGSVAISAYTAEMKQVTVTVSWTEPAVGISRNVALSTLVADTGGL